MFLVFGWALITSFRRVNRATSDIVHVQRRIAAPRVGGNNRPAMQCPLISLYADPAEGFPWGTRVNSMKCADSNVAVKQRVVRIFFKTLCWFENRIAVRTGCPFRRVPDCISGSDWTPAGRAGFGKPFPGEAGRFACGFWVWCCGYRNLIRFRFRIGSS